MALLRDAEALFVYHIDRWLDRLFSLKQEWE